MSRKRGGSNFGVKVNDDKNFEDQCDTTIKTKYHFWEFGLHTRYEERHITGRSSMTFVKVEHRPTERGLE